MSGLIVMSAGYAILSVPILSTATNIGWLLPLTCFALFLIAFGNGLFKGNLQAIVGQMYDNFEREAEKDGPEAVKLAKSRRDSGFQIFYVFINIGGLVAPFVAPLLREWWLNAHALAYNADLPALCHQYLAVGQAAMDGSALANLQELVTKVGGTVTADLTAFCTQYLDVFNTGIHYSFIASVAAMLLSLIIFVTCRRKFPTPAKKQKQEAENYTAEERQAMAKEIKQRLYALFAVLGIVIFFWLSFHQNGQSLSLFARDFVVTESIAPEIWQAVNPFFVITLTPLIMLLFGMDKSLRLWLDGQYPEVRYCAQVAPLIEAFAAQSRLGNTRKMFAHLRREYMDVCCYDNGQLLLANSYSCSLTPDRIYYLLYVWQALGFEQERDELHLCGVLDDRDALLSGLREFVRQVFVMNPPQDIDLRSVLSFEIENK